MNNREKYDEVIRKSFEIENDTDITSVERGNTDNWDSLGHMSLVGNIEEAFDIMLEMEDILHFDSYCMGIEILKKYGIEI